MFRAGIESVNVLDETVIMNAGRKVSYNSAYGMNGMLDIGCDARIDAMTYYMI